MSEIYLSLLVVLWARPSNVLPITPQTYFIELCLFIAVEQVQCLGIERIEHWHADSVVLDKEGAVLSTWVREEKLGRNP